MAQKDRFYSPAGSVAPFLLLGTSTYGPSIDSVVLTALRKTASFLSFPYVCPEPVLAK